MHRNTSQHITVHHNTSQRITVQHNTLQCITVHHSIPQHITVHHSTSQYITVHHNKPQHITTHHNTPQYIKVHHSTHHSTSCDHLHVIIYVYASYALLLAICDQLLRYVTCSVTTSKRYIPGVTTCCTVLNHLLHYTKPSVTLY